MGYYEAEPGLSIREVARRWIQRGDKMYDSSMPYPVETLDAWQYRDYTWTRETARPGHGDRYVYGQDSKYYDKGTDKWDALKTSLARGWSEDDPLIITIGRKDSRVKLGEGNHRLAVARELGQPKVPVRFVFYDSVCQTSNTSRIPVTLSFKDWLENEESSH